MMIRNLCGNDIAACAALLDKDQPFLGVTESRFVRKIVLEENYSPHGFFVAEEDGRILGFLNAVFRQVPIRAGEPMEAYTGWFSAFCVPDPADVPTVGRALLETGERYLVSHGKTRISTGFYPTYFSQGIEASHTAEIVLFREMGYTGAESMSLACDLTAYREQPDVAACRQQLLRDGFYLGAVQTRLIPSLLDPHSPIVNASWAYEFRSRIENGDMDALRVCADGDTVVGVAGCHDPMAPDGRFGPFGVDPAYRRRGIGSVLLADAILEMKRRGCTASWMQWVTPNGAAYRLYEKVGYRHRNTFYTFSKTLPTE